MDRRSSLAVALTALGSWTCSQQPTGVDAGFDDAGAGTSDAGPDAGFPDSGTPDAGLGLDCGDQPPPAGFGCGTLAWAASPVPSRLRNHHFTFVAHTDAGPFLYVLGGLNGQSASGVLADVDRAAIAADGSLAPFANTTPLAVATAGMIGAVVGPVLFIGGGHALRGVTDQAFRSTIQADGALGPWTAAGSLLHPRMHGGAVVFGDTIYVLGGFDGASTVWSDVVSARVLSDGTLSAWTPSGSLPQPLSHFSAAVAGTQVYLAGGLDRSAFDNPPELTTVYRGSLAADGTLGGWVAETALPVGLATHASFVYGGKLYVAGGIDNVPDEEDRVWSAPIDSGGSLGAWQEAAKLPLKRAHVHQIARWKNWFYSVAGATDFQLDSIGEIDVGTFQ